MEDSLHSVIEYGGTWVLIRDMQQTFACMLVGTLDWSIIQVRESESECSE